MSIQGSVNQLLTYSALGAGGLYSSLSKNYDRRLDKTKKDLNEEYNESVKENDKERIEALETRAKEIKALNPENNIASVGGAMKELKGPSERKQRANARAENAIYDRMLGKQALEDRKKQIREANMTFNEGRTEAGGVGRF